MRALVMNLPSSIKGFVVRSFDAEYGDFVYTVVINGNLSAEEQRKTYKHEAEHIANGDFDCQVSVDILEHLRH